ncbi:hypothetical protein AB0M52_15180, partial [Micromonospora sp. NPDC051296]
HVRDRGGERVEVAQLSDQKRGRRVAAHQGGRPAGRWANARSVLTVAGFAAIVYAMAANSATAKTAPEPLGLPAAALVAYLAGAGTLRLLRSGWGTRG